MFVLAVLVGTDMPAFHAFLARLGQGASFGRVEREADVLALGLREESAVLHVRDGGGQGASTTTSSLFVLVVALAPSPPCHYFCFWCGFRNTEK